MGRPPGSATVEAGRESLEDERMGMRKRGRGSHLMLTSSRKPLLRTVVRLTLYLWRTDKGLMVKTTACGAQHYLST